MELKLLPVKSKKNIVNGGLKLYMNSTTICIYLCILAGDLLSVRFSNQSNCSNQLFFGQRTLSSSAGSPPMVGCPRLGSRDGL